jgi:hypothetical protein
MPVASPAFMRVVGPAIKLGHTIMMDPRLKRDIDKVVDSKGEYLNARTMQEQMGLPYITEDSPAHLYVLWALTFVERVFGIKMPNVIFYNDHVNITWEEVDG